MCVKLILSRQICYWAFSVVFAVVLAGNTLVPHKGPAAFEKLNFNDNLYKRLLSFSFREGNRCTALLRNSSTRTCTRKSLFHTISFILSAL